MRTCLALAAGVLLLLFFVQLPSCGATPRVLAEGKEPDCRPYDISIDHYEMSSVGLPTWQVRFVNLCTNPRCSISSIIVHCGEFHTGGLFVNPKVFRRLDVKQGTCIVNDRKVLPNGHMLAFRYREIWKQPITFMYAKISCH